MPFHGVSFLWEFHLPLDQAKRSLDVFRDGGRGGFEWGQLTPLNIFNSFEYMEEIAKSFMAF